MKSKLLLGLLMLSIVFLVATVSDATTFRTERFALRGTGSFMAQPPIFGGNIVYGTLSPGTFWFALDDTGWPVDDVGTPQNERWDYIFSHYFHYHSTVGSEGWDGYFPPAGTGEPMPRWRFKTTAGDTLGGGVTQLIITIRDLNANGVVDANEYASKVMSGNFVDYINYNGGCFRNFCGSGNFSGTLKVLNAETWQEEWYVPSETSASGRLYLRDDGCTVGVESSSWGKIKSIYR